MRKLLQKLRLNIKLLLRNYMPRWSILILDIGIVVMCFTAFWFFRETLSAHDYTYFLLKIVTITGIYIFSSIVFRAHHGVVRFSTWKDLYRVVLSNIMAIVLFTILGIFANSTTNGMECPVKFQLWFGPMVGLIILAMQLLMRFTVRSVFSYLESNIPKEKKNIFILGSEHDSVLLAQSIRDENQNPYKPVAFIALKEAHVGKSLAGIPVLSAKSGIKGHMERYKVQSMLLYKNQIDIMPKEFYDLCIVDGLELLAVTSFSKYKGEESETNVPTAPQINKIKIEDLLGRNAIDINKDLLAPYFEGKSILITGAAGSIGSEICTQLTNFKCKRLTLLDQAETPLNDLFLTLSPLKGDIKIKSVIGSVSNEAKMRQVFECARPDIVFHAAAYKHVPMTERHPSAAVITNVLGTKVVADLSIEFGIERFVMISTDKAVNPTNVMGATKRAAEIYIQSLFHHLKETRPEIKTHFVTTRFGNVLGSNGSVVPLFKRQIEDGGPVTVTHRDIVRYFMTIPEACSLVLEAGCIGNGGQIYIFDMGEAVKIYDLAEKMIRLAGKTPGKDIEIVETGLRPGEKLYEELLATDENTLPTPHRKLRIAKVRQYRFDYIRPRIHKLITTAAEWTQPIEVVKLLKNLIPEFISQCSPEYEKLDMENGYKEQLPNEQKFIDK
ncbi:MAG: nucleoside-diphosphate sugar epimerase/dehydratase [Rikenellaceae bacterium]|nr:nucleoside-diphosphate sugar epimerase/dehydratase [Rikenellaceae bacterium]